jgi:hypothetical protein
MAQAAQNYKGAYFSGQWDNFLLGADITVLNRKEVA